jgi:glycosyltransferase involved in cell wall biosynthesis
VGALEPRKGLHYAIEAVAALCQRRPQTSLHVVGSTLDEGYARALQIYVRSHGVEGNVRFLGFIDQNQLLDEYRHCCLLVLPSREETSPLSVQQAMAAGKAVVATRAGGIPHLVEDGVTGCLVEWSDVRQLANTLDSLLGDEELRRRLGVLGKRRADEQFRIEPIARRTLEIYQEVLKDASYQDAARPASAGIQGR